MSALPKIDATEPCGSFQELVDCIAQLCIPQPFDPKLYELVTHAASMSVRWAVDTTNLALDASDRLMVQRSLDTQDKPESRLLLSALARMNAIRDDAEAVEFDQQH